MVLSVLIASLVSDPVSFFIVFALGVGLGKGLAFPASMKAGWIYLPHRKGLVSGIITSSLSIGSIFIGIFCTMIVNPNNLKSTTKTCSKHGLSENIFPASVN